MMGTRMLAENAERGWVCGIRALAASAGGVRGAETEKTEETERGNLPRTVVAEWLVGKHRLAETPERSLNGFCSQAPVASGSPASAQPAWERLCAASRGNKAAS